MRLKLTSSKIAIQILYADIVMAVDFNFRNSRFLGRTLNTDERLSFLNMGRRMIVKKSAQKPLLLAANGWRLLFVILSSSGLIFSHPTLAQAVSDQGRGPDDGPPLLKLDTPKLDLTPPPPSRTLKGGVHHEVTELSVGENKLGGQNNKKLSSGVFDLCHKKKNAKLNAQTAKIAPASGLKSGASQNTLSGTAAANVPNGIGIIGVKFLLSFGRMPVINRVFPGTPAWTMGLHARDIIVAVDGVPTLGLSKEDVYGMIVGKPDTEVTISIRRDGDFIAKTMKRMDFNDIPDPMVRQDYLMSI